MEEEEPHVKPDQDRKLISRRTFIAGGAAAIGGMTLAACAGGGTTSAGAAGAPPGARDAAGKTNITVWFWDDSPQRLSLTKGLKGSHARRW